MAFSQAPIIEHFHLAFLQVLQRRLEPARFVLKGGANLRYFFGSHRYSEDIDLDLIGPQPRDQIDRTLESPALAAVLGAGGLAVAGYTTPKQTPTTRRWKLEITVAGSTEPVRTRIELSNRGPAKHEYLLEAVPAEIVAAYALRPPTVQHYDGPGATAQKVDALAGRSQTQARDVFDLELLLRRRPLPQGAIGAELLEQASERALELSFGAFQDQVLPFLDGEVAELYDSPGDWEQMQTFVAESLEAGR